jgi:spore photoproduct lyase
LCSFADYRYINPTNLGISKEDLMDDKMEQWKPKEIIIHQSVKDDPVTQYFVDQCQGVPVKYITSGIPKEIVKTSEVLGHSMGTMLDKILLGKQVVYIAPATDVVDIFTMPDDRMVCPHFERLKLASNGCFYQCDWCYLKLTYRAAFPFITVRVQYDRIKEQIQKRLNQSREPVIFNSGELADSLSMEHLTRAGREFIPWFGQTQNGYLYMLTKSDNVNDILDLPHNGRTVIAWSMNNGEVSRKFEIGSPSFEQRLAAAKKIQEAGYRVRIRLDPIVPFEGWQSGYKDTIKRIFQTISPESVTIGTLRFEEGFYKMRNTFFTNRELTKFVGGMVPMFSPKLFPGTKRPKSGKHSFPEEKRAKIFSFVIAEIRKNSDCPIALCKESATVWEKVGLPLSQCSCACQLDPVDMALKDQGDA